MNINNLILFCLFSLVIVACKKDTADTTNNSNWSLHSISTGGPVEDGYLIQFFGKQTIFIGGYDNALYSSGISWYSSDNGINWNRSIGNFEGRPIKSISLINDSSAYVISTSIGGPDLFYTNDYCLSFSKNNLSTTCAPSFGENSIHFFNDSIGLIGNKRTENSGQTWNCSSNPNNRYYYFLNDNVGYSCSGNDLLKTIDTALNWVNIYSSSKNLNEVKFFDESNGFLLEGEDLSKTLNGGANWTRIFTKVSSFFFINNEVGFLTSESKIFKTIDSGITWTLVFESNKIKFLDIGFNGTTAVAVGEQLSSQNESFIAISYNP